MTFQFHSLPPVEMVSLLGQSKKKCRIRGNQRKKYKRYLPTLHEVDYQTTEGNGKIIITPKGTDQYNIHLHGGNITMKSWLEHKRHILVHCSTSFATEGIMD
jgi:hypothetical protein